MNYDKLPQNCPKCSRSFSTKLALSNHLMRTHSPEREVMIARARAQAQAQAGETVEIPLSKGKVALIDPEDAERVLAYCWYFNDIYAGYAAKSGSESLHCFIMQPPKGMEVDHKNLNPLDCRRKNMRIATPSQNQHNKARYASGYKGVYRVDKSDKYAARICLQRKRYNLGVFPSPEEAARAYDAKARALHGEFARLNFPDEGEQAA